MKYLNKIKMLTTTKTYDFAFFVTIDAMLGYARFVNVSTSNLQFVRRL